MRTRLRNIFAALAMIFPAAALAQSSGNQCQPVPAVNDIAAMSAVRAIALNCIPNVCPNGQYSTGIDIYGNAVGCTNVAQSTSTFSSPVTFESDVTIDGNTVMEGSATVNGPATFNGPVFGILFSTQVVTSNVEGTVYQNTGTIPWRANVIFAITANASAQAYSDNNADPITPVWSGEVNGGINTPSSILTATFDIMPGAFYKVIGPAVTQWVEWH